MTNSISKQEQEHELRMALAHAVYLDRQGILGGLEAAIAAYNAPLPPEPVLVTDEMLEAYKEAWDLCRGYQFESDKRRTGIAAALRLSPVIKRAQEWRDMYQCGTRSQQASASGELCDALQDAGL